MNTQVEMKSGRLAVSGELTVYSAPQLRELFDKGNLELDLAEVTEIDTAGLQLLLMLRRRARAAGSQLRVVAASKVVREILTLCGLAEEVIS